MVQANSEGMTSVWHTNRDERCLACIKFWQTVVGDQLIMQVELYPCSPPSTPSRIVATLLSNGYCAGWSNKLRGIHGLRKFLPRSSNVADCPFGSDTTLQLNAKHFVLSQPSDSITSLTKMWDSGEMVVWLCTLPDILSRYE
eukprot:1227753-Amphidinium_carterae.1